MFRYAGLIFFICGLSALAPAQLNPGDYVIPVSSSSSYAVVQVTPGGTVKTLFTLPWPALALTMATNNTDLAVVGRPPTSKAGFVATVTPAGVVTSLATYASYIYENMAVDSNGTFVVPAGVGGTDVIIRCDRFGTLTTLNPSPPVGGGKPRGIAVDTYTGGYLIGDIPVLYRIARDGTATSITSGVAINNSIDMVSDARTLSAIIAQQNSLVSVDTVTGTMSTIQGGFNGCFPGLAYDRTNDGWILAGSCSNTNSFIFRIARGGGVTTVAPLVGSMDVEVYGSLNIVGAGDPTPGATLSLRFSEPSSPGELYLAGASLSTSPGIFTPAGVVDLTPDTLFAVSQQVPSLFVNFMGVLDSGGSAIAAVAVPKVASLKGLRFYISFVTIRKTAIHRIANTQGFTIQ